MTVGQIGNADTIIFDHTDIELAFDVDLSATHDVSLGADRALGVQQLTGNGEVLSAVGINFAIQGDTLNVDAWFWEVYIWESLNDLESDYYRDDPPSEAFRFDVTLTNPDRFDVLGEVGGLPFFYAEADIVSEGFTLAEGQEYAIALAPSSGPVDGLGGIVFSSGNPAFSIGDCPSWYGHDNGIPPAPLHDIEGAPADFFGYRVTTVPPPSGMAALLVTLSFASVRRR